MRLPGRCLNDVRLQTGCQEVLHLLCRRKAVLRVLLAFATGHLVSSGEEYTTTDCPPIVIAIPNSMPH